ncbi:MAG: helix-turn-helix domain-containing protein [bacterium]
MPKKPGPKDFTPKNRTPEQLEDIVVKLALDHPSLGPLPLADELFDKHGIILNQATIWRILTRRKTRIPGNTEDGRKSLPSTAWIHPGKSFRWMVVIPLAERGR